MEKNGKLKEKWFKKRWKTNDNRLKMTQKITKIKEKTSEKEEIFFF